MNTVKQVYCSGISSKKCISVLLQQPRVKTQLRTCYPHFQAARGQDLNTGSRILAEHITSPIPVPIPKHLIIEDSDLISTSGEDTSLGLMQSHGGHREFSKFLMWYQNLPCWGSAEVLALPSGLMLSVCTHSSHSRSLQEWLQFSNTELGLRNQIHPWQDTLVTRSLDYC
jgi:hypothetical protein